MFFDQIKSTVNNLRIATLLLVDSDNADNGGDNGGSDLDKEKVHEKIAASKSRRIPVVKFILLLTAIIVTFIVLEYFI